MLKQTLLAALTAANIATTSAAEPDETIAHLMDDSPSMLDFGIFRLERFLNKTGQVSEAVIRYDWDRNAIEISGRFFDGHTISEGEALQKCDSWFETMREIAGIDIETGKLQPWYEVSEFAWHFKHIGSVQREHSMNHFDEQKLDQTFRIRFVVADVANASHESFRLICDGALLSNDYAISY